MFIYQNADLPVTSVNALRSTIRTDSQVRRWFSHLISKKEIKGNLSGDQEVAEGYKRLKNITFQENVISVLFFVVFLLIAVTGKFQYGFLFGAFLGYNFYVQSKKKTIVDGICAVLINKDFEKESFAQKTLYQIGEFYSRKYNIESLVNAVTSVDGITRKAVFYTIIFATFIYPLDFWQICGSVLVAYYIFNGFVSSSVVYGRVK